MVFDIEVARIGLRMASESSGEQPDVEVRMRVDEAT